jgi:hypothetical protein
MKVKSEYIQFCLLPLREKVAFAERRSDEGYPSPGAFAPPSPSREEGKFTEMSP